MIAVLLLDGVAYTVRLTQASALTQFLVRGCLSWGANCCELIAAQG
ncbi:MAG: hypothetical protein ACKERG_02830 [Candidatus Hodgkinia cicadicola]